MWIGLKVEKGHVTVTWLGKNKTLEQVVEIKEDLKYLESLCPIVLKFGEWTILGKPKEIKRGQGVSARMCEIIDEKTRAALTDFHKKWYHHEEGESEERKSRQLYHLTVGKMSREEIEKLNVVECNEIFMK